MDYLEIENIFFSSNTIYSIYLNLIEFALIYLENKNKIFMI